MSYQVPFFSIIIPTYNRKELLSKALASIFNQMNQDAFQFEILVVDDGSTDGTLDLLGQFKKEYGENIEYFFQENSGVGKARNKGLQNISSQSDYVIFLDSDDEFRQDLLFSIISKFNELKDRGIYEKTIGLYFLCQDESGNTMDGGVQYDQFGEKKFTYQSFLQGEVNFAMMQVIKTSFFRENSFIRFPEDVINETVMFVQMWQYMNKKNLQMVLWGYVGYVYRQEHHEFKKITHTLSQDRFRKNAIGNERVLSYIKEDLITNKYFHIYADYLFRIGINWVLAGEKIKGLDYLRNSLNYKKSLRNSVVFILAHISRLCVLSLYKMYTR